jgi:hypothetical protein
MAYLGAEVCSTPMCSAGAASVDQMQSVFDALGSPSEFSSAVAGVKSAFDANYSAWDDWIPFNPVCCTIRDLGVSADTLTNQMQTKYGQTPTGTGPATNAPGAELPTLGQLSFGLVAVAALALVLVLHK